MKTLLSRAALAAFLATSLSAGLLAFAPAASAQVSPADPNYSYDTRGKTVLWGGGTTAYAQAPAPIAQSRNAVRGQDPDPNVRLQSLRTQGLFDR